MIFTYLLWSNSRWKYGCQIALLVRSVGGRDDRESLACYGRELLAPSHVCSWVIYPTPPLIPFPDLVFAMLKQRLRPVHSERTEQKNAQQKDVVDLGGLEKIFYSL